MEFLFIVGIGVFVFLYRVNEKESAYDYVVGQVGVLYEKYAPFSFKSIREKVKALGQEYTARQYLTQVLILGGLAAGISYLYFYDLVVMFIYALIAIATVPFLANLRCKKVYNEFIFEQIQIYTTNTIMEFQTTKSFVKALEGVLESKILEDPIKSDVKVMIDLAYKNGAIDESIKYMNEKYNYQVVKNMHQLFIQITNEGAQNTDESLENMLQDIDMLVEAVYRDKMDREVFHKKFLNYGFMLYLLVLIIQVMMQGTYVIMTKLLLVKILLHLIIIFDTYFLLGGEKYYNENVGGE